MCGWEVTLETGGLIPGTRSRKASYPGDWMYPRVGSGKGSPWRLWTCDPRCRVWEADLLWKLEMYCKVHGLGGGVTLETVDL